MTRQQQKFCCQISDEQKEMIKSRQTQVYETGKFDKPPSVKQAPPAARGYSAESMVRGGGSTPIRTGPLGADMPKPYPGGIPPHIMDQMLYE